MFEPLLKQKKYKYNKFEINLKVFKMTELNKKLNEDTVGCTDPNIADTDEIVNIKRLFLQGSLPSLARSALPDLPISGPTGGFVNARKKDGTNDLELVRNNVEVFPSKSIKTGITREAIQDLRATYGEETDKYIAMLLRGLANTQENERFIQFLTDNAYSRDDVHLDAPDRSEDVFFEISQAVERLVLEMNSKSFRTYESFAIMPYHFAASISATVNYNTGGEDYDKLQVSKLGKTKYYISTDANDTSTVFVGLSDKEDVSKSCAIFNHYVTDLVNAVDPETGNSSIHIFNRYAMTMNPLHTEDKPMLLTFKVFQ